MSIKRVIIAGSRDFNDYTLLRKECDRSLPKEYKWVIISGCAAGADTLAVRYARERKLPVIKMPANWKRWGNAAGPRRNEEMAKIADLCICFWDGKSRGTKNMINICQRRGIQCIVIT